MRKFCCELWNSAVDRIQTLADKEIHSSSLTLSAETKTISLWPNYCPACGLSLTSPPTSEGSNIIRTSAQSTQPSSCPSCKGTGRAGGRKDATIKCIVCLGTGKLSGKKDTSDSLVKIEDLKNKIRREKKPVRPESLNPKLIK